MPLRATRLEEGLVLFSIDRSQAPRPGTDRLTPAEREVAMLAAAGLSNSAIATRRGRSANTVANQLAAACAKIGVAGRRQLRATLGQVE